MSPEERKARFIELLEELLQSSEGIQSRLAKKLHISSARLSSWFQRQIDPINLETGIFEQISRSKGCSTDELAELLGFPILASNLPNNFQNLINELLSNQTQEELGTILGVKQTAISHWLNPIKNVDPAKINAGTMFAIAQAKGWKFDEVLSYIGLKDEILKKNLLLKYKSELNLLPLKDQIELLAWLSILVNQRVKKEDVISLNNKSLIKILFILEQDDVAIASNYFSNLAEYLQFEPKNIKIATIPKLPQSLADIDILIFDINTADSPSIQLIEDLTFNGDIIIFADAIALPLIREKVSSVVSEIFVKPVDWSALQSFPYFQSK